jgi:hypothetical protein
VIYLSDDGVLLFDGNSVVNLSQAINAELLTLPESAEDWTATWNPGTERYQLHTDTGTWIYHVARKRWTRRSTVIDHGVVFPAQYESATWETLSGSWEDLVGTWELVGAGGIEKGLPTLFVRNGVLGVETAGVETVFGDVVVPTFELGRETDQMPLTQFTTTELQLAYDGTGTVGIDLPGQEGDWVSVVSKALAGRTTDVPVIHTGRGVGVRLRYTAGDPKVKQVALRAMGAGRLLRG